MRRAEIKKGDRFGKLSVIGPAGHICKHRAFLFRCDCGLEKRISLAHAKSGHTTSCGCKQTLHGHSKKNSSSATYTTWSSMIARCLNKKTERFPRYGGRGIKVCDRWLDFRNFLADMGEKPEGKSIDRINNNGNYEPSNCRWATVAEQVSNKSTTRKITFYGKTHTYAEWSRITGIPSSTLYNRVQAGCSPEQILSKTYHRNGRKPFIPRPGIKL